MKELIEKMSRQKEAEPAEQMADRMVGELKKEKVRRVHSAMDEVYIEAGDDEASLTFDPRTNKAFVRLVLYREVDATGKAVADLLKKHGVSF